MRCGDPANSIRGRIYVDFEAERIDFVLHTGGPDPKGILSGVVQQAKH